MRDDFTVGLITDAVRIPFCTAVIKTSCADVRPLFAAQWISPKCLASIHFVRTR
jgi:hypothetical protein